MNSEAPTVAHAQVHRTVCWWVERRPHKTASLSKSVFSSCVIKILSPIKILTHRNPAHWFWCVLLFYSLQNVTRQNRDSVSNKHRLRGSNGQCCFQMKENSPELLFNCLENNLIFRTSYIWWSEWSALIPSCSAIIRHDALFGWWCLQGRAVGNGLKALWPFCKT